MRSKAYSVELSDEAESDFDTSFKYYQTVSAKTAAMFFKIINQSFESIKHNPLAYPIVHEDVRKYVVKKVPFVLYYQIVESVIRVVAIFHTSRNPEVWNERVNG